MVTLKGENAFVADEMEAQAREQLEGAHQKLEEAGHEGKPKRARRVRGERKFSYFQTTPYRTKDTPEKPQP
jgi:hypothetical protein